MPPKKGRQMPEDDIMTYEDDHERVKIQEISYEDDCERLHLPMPKWSVRITNARNALEASLRLLDHVQDDFTNLDKDSTRSMLFRAGELIGDARVLVKDARDDIIKRFDK